MSIKGLCYENYIQFWIMHSENTEVELLLPYLHFHGNTNILKELKHIGDVIGKGQYKLFFSEEEQVGGQGLGAFLFNFLVR